MPLPLSPARVQKVPKVRNETHLVLGVATEDVEAGDVQAELFRFGEFAEADAQGDQVGAGDGDGLADHFFADVVDAGAVETEDVGLWESRVMMSCARVQSTLNAAHSHRRGCRPSG